MYTFLLLWTFDFERKKVRGFFWAIWVPKKNLQIFKKYLKNTIQESFTKKVQFCTRRLKSHFFLTHPLCFLNFISLEFSIRNKNIWSEIASKYKYYRLTGGSIWFGKFHEISCIGRILWTCIGMLLCTCSTPGFGGFVLIWYILHYRVSHGNSVTNCISSLLWISIVIPNFKSHNIIMSARVYFLKRVKDCKDVSIIVYSVCMLKFSCFTKYTLMQSKHKQTKCEHSKRNSCRLQLSQLVSLY